MVDFFKNLLTGLYGVLLAVLIFIVFLAIAVFIPGVILYVVLNVLGYDIGFLVSSGIILLLYIVLGVIKNI